MATALLSSEELEKILAAGKAEATQLQAELDALALKALSGDQAAGERVTHIRQRLVELEEELRIAGAALREAQAREAQARAEAEAAHRRELEAQQHRLMLERAKLAGECDKLAEKLQERLDRILALGKQIYVLDSQLRPEPRFKLMGKHVISNWVLWLVDRYAPGEIRRPADYYRQPLSKLFGGESDGD